jgi:hypothetical protein
MHSSASNSDVLRDSREISSSALSSVSASENSLLSSVSYSSKRGSVVMIASVEKRHSDVSGPNSVREFCSSSDA